MLPQARPAAALLGVSVVGFLVRALPLIGRGGALGYPIDYDEGVYFSASALLTHGTLPYRDFVFVHPPGVLFALAPFTAWTHVFDPGAVFAVLRFLMAAVGAANVFLVGWMTRRWVGFAGGLFAAALYALYPEVVVVERGPFLEPFLNLTCLLFALLWLQRPRELSDRAALGAGLILAVAVSVKLLGGIWAVAALLTLPVERRWRIAGFMFAGGVLGALLLIGVIAAFDANQFWADAVAFHSSRPPDGEIARLGRVGPMFAGPHVLGSLLAAAALVLHFRKRTPDYAFFAAVFGLTIAAFLSTRSYWSQYNSYLAPSAAILAGAGFAALLELRTPAKAWSRAAWVVGALVLLAPTALRVRKDSRTRAPEQTATGADLRSAPPSAPLFAFEPAWGIVGGRLPDVSGDKPAIVVDPYASMLMDAMTQSAFASAGEAFESPASQRRVRALLERSSIIVLGWRGSWQLSAETEEWLRAHFRRRFPSEGAPGIDSWERSDLAPR